MNKLATVQGGSRDHAIPNTFAQRGKRGFFAPSPGDRTFLEANLCSYEFAVATEAAATLRRRRPQGRGNQGGEREGKPGERTFFEANLCSYKFAVATEAAATRDPPHS